MNLLRFSRRELLLILIVFSVAFLFRFINLASWPIFADEAIYIRWAQVMRAEETLRFLPLSDGKQPLFMWLMIPFLKIFSDPLLAGRFLSVVCGILTMFGILVFSFLIFNDKKISLFALFLYSISPFNVFFERMALVDSMLSMFGLWSFIFALLALKLKRLDFAIFSGFCLGGGLITKSPALFFVIILPFVLLLVDWRKNFK
ncbi:MAG: ArnT family glycosyltransferase, partial [Minisyncoccia bacterium]